MLFSRKHESRNIPLPGGVGVANRGLVRSGSKGKGNDKKRKIVEFTFTDIFALIYKITIDNQ